MESNPWAATKRGKAFSVRRPAAAAASTRPPTTLISRAMASQDRQRRRNPAWNTSLTAPTARSFRDVSLPFPMGVPKVATL
jgi:hypothetical protein